jgi:hypothetical protein
MAGSSDDHDEITLNLIEQLRAHYQPGDRIFLESVELELPIEERYKGVRISK